MRRTAKLCAVSTAYAEFALPRQAGIAWARGGFDWTRGETQEGERDFSLLDAARAEIVLTQR